MSVDLDLVLHLSKQGKVTPDHHLSPPPGPLFWEDEAEGLLSLPEQRDFVFAPPLVTST